MMRTGSVVFALVLGLPIAYYVYWQHQYDGAEAEARKFCGALTDGSELSGAIARAEDLKGVRHGFLEPKALYSVSFNGPIFNVVQCRLTVADGKITSRSVSWIAD